MIDERALQAAIPVGSNMANAELVRAIIKAYEAARSAEPVAWRWRPKDGSTLWIYDPEIEWLERQGDRIDKQPLYTHPKESPDV